MCIRDREDGDVQVYTFEGRGIMDKIVEKLPEVVSKINIAKPKKDKGKDKDKGKEDAKDESKEECKEKSADETQCECDGTCDDECKEDCECDDECSCSEAVSYTHLDVYKRQRYIWQALSSLRGKRRAN